jgi:hypothetical protein
MEAGVSVANIEKQNNVCLIIYETKENSDCPTGITRNTKDSSPLQSNSLSSTPLFLFLLFFSSFSYSCYHSPSCCSYRRFAVIVLVEKYVYKLILFQHIFISTHAQRINLITFGSTCGTISKE